VNRGLLAAILIAGAALRLAWVVRPLDHRLRSPWRQADTLQIARNFAREDGSILHPRIDWRGTTPGLVEMEFPFFPWIGGMLFRPFGIHAEILRALSALAEIGSLLLFASLARRLLPDGGALLAIAAYAFNPLLLYLSTALQPEALMLFLGLLSVVLLERYRVSRRGLTLVLAGGALGASILAKAPAACLGMLFGWVVLRVEKAFAFRRPAVYAAAALALLPSVAWYGWAKHLYLLYGNSLGLSNENPFLGLDMLFPPRFLLGIARWETLGVLTPFGWLLLVCALSAPIALLEFPLVWYASAVVFFVAAARTTADDWAFYYHGVAVAPASILMGAGFAAVRRAWPGVARLLAAGTLACLLGAAAYLLHARDHRPDLRAMRQCGLRFAASIPPSDSIVVHGGGMTDAQGIPVAHNESMMFAWLDRRGFTYGDEELSVETLERLGAHGGRFWIASPDELRRKVAAEVLRRRFRLLDQCPDGYALFDLQQKPAS
jgi:hypothetical protein